MLAPVVRGRKGEFKKELQALRQRGFTKARIDGQFRSLDEDLKLDRRRNHNIDIVVDRLIVKSGIERRLSESLETALGLADEIVVVNTFEGGDQLFSRRLACVDCGISMPEMTPRAFSFNSPHGACPDCQGLGATYDFDPRLVVPDESKSLLERRDCAVGARRPQAGAGSGHDAGQDVRASIPMLPFAKLPKKHRDLVLFGPAAGTKAAKAARSRCGVGTTTTMTTRRTTSSSCRVRRAAGGVTPIATTDPFGRASKGVIPNLRRRYEEGSWAVQEDLEPYRTLRECPACHGQRLRPQSLAVQVKGRGMADYVNLPDQRGARGVRGVRADRARSADRGAGAARDSRAPARSCDDVGVGYLTLNRSAATLSGGEGQRIRLATQIGANLTGVLYVLDEPSIGLHQRDNRKLLVDAGAPARPRQHRRGRRARRGNDPHGRLRRRSRARRRRARRRRHLPGLAAAICSTNGNGSLTGAYLRGERSIADAAVAASGAQGARS